MGFEPTISIPIASHPTVSFNIIGGNSFGLARFLLASAAILKWERRELNPNPSPSPAKALQLSYAPRLSKPCKF